MSRRLFVNSAATCFLILFRKEHSRKCCVQQLLVEGPKAVPELDGEITLKILVGLAFSILPEHQFILCRRRQKC